MPTSWLKAAYNPRHLNARKSVSIAVAEIKTSSGQVERVKSVSGKAWYGTNSSKYNIQYNCVDYKTIRPSDKKI